MFRFRPPSLLLLHNRIKTLVQPNAPHKRHKNPLPPQLAKTRYRMFLQPALIHMIHLPRVQRYHRIYKNGLYRTAEFIEIRNMPHHFIVDDRTRFEIRAFREDDERHGCGDENDFHEALGAFEFLDGDVRAVETHDGLGVHGDDPGAGFGPGGHGWRDRDRMGCSVAGEDG